MKEVFELGLATVEGIGNGEYLLERKQFNPDTGEELRPARQSVTVGALKETIAQHMRQAADLQTVVDQIDELE
jgi:hypothetical protein